MNSILQAFTGDTPWLADAVYPLLAGICAMVAVLSLAWYRLPPRPRHPLHLYVAIVSASLIMPALLASAATGEAPSVDISSVRNLLRLSWLMVACVLFSVVIYYVRRFLCLLVSKNDELSDQLKRWSATLDRGVSGD